MRIAIVAPSAVPFVIGGAEKLWWGLQDAIHAHTPHHAELIKLPSPEQTFFEIVDSYRRFANLDLAHFDRVISTKYPAWMVAHDHHVVYLQHRLRGLYDTWPGGMGSVQAPCGDPRVDAVLGLIRAHPGERAALVECFDRLAEIEAGKPLPESLHAFPGPLIRELVHYFDGVGLHPDRIRRHAAISDNVARRRDYFPSGARVEVVHHPSDLRALRGGPQGDYLLSVGRLDGPKRVALQIGAIKRARSDVRLKIAGVGPEMEALRAQAGDDPRIELLGFVEDAELEALYAGALGVIYTPFDEDYGLVPFEAMSAGKPLIATTDSGGPLELMRDGEHGYLAEPDEASLAEVIERLDAGRSAAVAMGTCGRRRAQRIDWSGVIRVVLGADALRDAPSPPGPSPAPLRRRIGIAGPFPIHPPQHGGQKRLFELYRALARRHDIEAVTFAQPGLPAFSGEIAPGLHETRIAHSADHLEAEARLSRALGWLPITDVAMPELYRRTPAYSEALARAVRGADLVIAAHPYLLPAVEEAWGGPVWYDALNVEAALKASVLPESALGRRLLDVTVEIEAACCERAARILTCSPDEVSDFTSRYGVDEGSVVHVPNGVDPSAIAFVPMEQRRAARRSMGVDDTSIALFVGSWHGPNVEAVRRLPDLARALPDVAFIVLGGVGDALAAEGGLGERPTNLAFMGVVDAETKALVARVASVALNPMSIGGGTNLKMLEYFAAGLPVISTPHGARGLAVEAGVHLCITEIEGFARAIASHGDDEDVRERVARARRLIEAHYDWRRIAEGLAAHVERSL